ncbi:MAG: alkaline phosphatase family protein [Candidatus Omnitrophica bacterium]|nr:alkaline phosphatase family protein [Candidatus Omnitrophota bacterium]
MKRILTGTLVVLAGIAGIAYAQKANDPLSQDARKGKKLYWFIPDGMRAEPYLFDIYAWAREGDLPNIKRMMDNGTYGFCRPVYPGHTPVNFAAILTGTYPQINGVSDGPMHTDGHSLVKPSMTGFSSTARKVEAIWSTLEKQGKSVMVFSVPGSTPPELGRGYTIAGRWGGWGANFYAVNFENIPDASVQYHRGRESRLFYFGPPLAVFPLVGPAWEWNAAPRSYSPPKESALEAWGAKIYAYIYDSTNDSIPNYDRVAFTADKKTAIADLKQGDQSEWLPVTVSWGDIPIDTTVRIKVITLQADGLFKIRFFYDNLNNTLTKPVFLADDIIKNVGPMVDYADSFPAQLIFSKEDKDAFIEEAGQSFDWHRRATDYLLKTYAPDIFIHDIYTPNQMLTSRWWLGYVDPGSLLYNDKTDEERLGLWREVKQMYKELDAIIGEYLKNADEDTVIAVSSDHGAVPLHRRVHLNNLFARQGWLFFKLDPVTGEPLIDWLRSTVVYLNYGHVFIDPAGLHGRDGAWRRSTGPRYKKLREEVRLALQGLRDESGTCPVMRIATWEESDRVFRLCRERIGDLILSNRPGYAWTEEMSDDKKIFSNSLITGYKQGILTEKCPAIWCPFIIMGPGVKKNNFLGNDPVDMIDQYPTLMKLLGVKLPDFVQGKPLEDVCE